MDALLLSLILCALVEGAGNTTRRYAGLCARYGPRGFAAVTAGMTLACAANALIAALAGLWIAPMLTPEARGLFLGAALAMAGAGLIAGAARAADRRDAENDTARAPLVVATTSLFIVGISGSAPLLIAALATYFADPWMAGIGGALGSIGGCMAGHRMGHASWMRIAYMGMGCVYLLCAFGMAMSGLRLI